MMIYGESDYWVARYRSLTEGSLKQAHAAEDRRRQARGTAFLLAFLGGIARRSAKKRPGFDRHTRW